ncbi:DNA helicase-2/ATP-dependent DNA helicase PcrA [Modicisalibacter xianhensis]|uniref:DNA 3'-5' helicase n=1 Tax=Modicisalibacter xianhensis TaxID=442341 RepID=A0A4R8G2E5_9GAMM|nr:ATP-dependent helicase [Halomonas xianhensis]TDX32283.1 DNA helicase-2/ATP-dependent DNA helicase PcrA [Halomonas xianhensis]
MKLTDEQWAVVRHERGHARVAAVAGAGKTTTLVARVLHLLAQGVPARRILVLMFNRAAREDFTAKLVAMASPGQSLPEVRTFHSIGHRLNQSLTRWGWLSPRELLTADWQRERLLRQAVQHCLGGSDEATRDAALDTERLEALGNFCDLVKAEMTSATEFYERMDFGPDTRHFIDAYEHFEALLEQHGRMTYADLLFRPLRCLESSEEARARVQGFLDHVIIDEYQDINEAQQRLLAVLAGTHADVMAVGDANQCIYEWRGARPDYMLERFEATFGQATDYPLSTTFRHGHALALTANHAIRGNRRRPDQLCVAAPQNPVTTIDAGQGAGRLIEELQAWQQRGRPLQQACVLVRNWTLSVAVQLQLLRAGIPFRLAREERYVFRLPLVQALAGYLRLSRDARLLHDPAHLLLLLSQPTSFVARERLQALALHLAQTQSWPGRQDALLGSLKPAQRRTLKRRWELLCELPRLGGLAPARLLEIVVERLDAEKVLKRAAARREKGEEDVRLLDVLIEQADDLALAPEELAERQRQPMQQGDGVLITTVHGAKGLEWPLVALWGMNEADFPYYSKDNPLDEERLEEERRLFYVAITRAQDRLLILHDSGEHRPSRFLAESAWQDGNRVARALVEQRVGPVEVNVPSLVGRYLAVVGSEITVEAASREEALQPAAVAEPAATYCPGQHVHHEVFGNGEILVVEGDPDNPVIDVRFVHAGRRRLIARRSPIEVLQGGSPA